MQVEGKCTDAEECLYVHSKTVNIGTKKRFLNKSNTEDSYCKDGLKCARVDCEYNDDKHQRIRDVPCRFQESCAKQECPFKHNFKSDFHKNPKTKRRI